MSSARAKLGQIMVAEGHLSSTQLSDALRQQVVFGGRAGTSIIELGFSDRDTVARALARQHGVPAALVHHFEHHDTELLKIIPRALVSDYIVFPIARILGSRKIVMCFRSPTREAIAAVANHCGAEVTPSVAAEVTVLEWIEHAYGLQRPPRYVQSAVPTTPLPRNTREIAAMDEDGIDIDFDDEASVDVDVADEVLMPGQMQLVDLDDAGVERKTIDYSQDHKKKSGALELGRQQSRIDLADAAAAAVSQAEQVTEAAAMSTAAALAAANAARPLTLAEAKEEILAAEQRESVSDAVLRFLRSYFESALITLVKGEMALGYRGFGGNFDNLSVESIMVPLGAPSMFQAAHRSKTPYIGPPPPDPQGIQKRFFKLFPGDAPASVCIYPIVLRDRMVCLIFGAPKHELSDKAASEIGEVCRAMEAAFLDLIKRARKSD